MFTRILALTLVLGAVSTARAETVRGPEPPPCDYSRYPLQRVVKLRGLLQLARYRGGQSANAPKWTAAHTLTVLDKTCDFEVRAPASLRLRRHEGYVVDVTGTITRGGVASFYTLTAQQIRRVRRYDGTKTSNQAMQLTGTALRVTFGVTSTRSLRARRALVPAADLLSR